jgi:hypothetical protein
MTGANSSTNGSTITINEDGLYQFTAKDNESGSGPWYFGFTINSTQLSTDVSSVTAANVIWLTKTCFANGPVALTSPAVILLAGDVVRVQVESANWGTGSFPFYGLQATQLARF